MGLQSGSYPRMPFIAQNKKLKNGGTVWRAVDDVEAVHLLVGNRQHGNDACAAVRHESLRWQKAHDQCYHDPFLGMPLFWKRGRSAHQLIKRQRPQALLGAVREGGAPHGR